MSHKVRTPNMLKREARLLAERKSGATINELAVTHGLTHTALKGILARNGMGAPLFGRVDAPTA
jgi:hypothetical protein